MKKKKNTPTKRPGRMSVAEKLIIKYGLPPETIKEVANQFTPEQLAGMEDLTEEEQAEIEKEVEEDFKGLDEAAQEYDKKYNKK